jgi:RHS repeat-associated protein
VRVATTNYGMTDDCLLDLAATLPVVISDTDAVYLYGLDIIAEQLAGADRYYYVHDGLGSVRQLVDSTGQIETRYTYDPFGVPLEGNGVPNPWQFTGEAWDAGVELLYLRARYYQPETGRFITKDPWAGDAWRPSTLNAYTYVDSNPSSYVDPSGLEGWGPGGLFPEITPGPAPPEYLEMVLMLMPIIPQSPIRSTLLLPHYQLWEMFLYWRSGHSPVAAANLSKIMGYVWVFQLGQEEYHFGPQHSLTQEVMASPNLARFRVQWAKPKELGGGGYELPYLWRGDRIEDTMELAGRRWETPQARLYREMAYHNLIMLTAMWGLGSLGPEGPINTVGGHLGSLDYVKVEEAENTSDMVKMEAMNTMGKASFSRKPGTTESRWKDELRSETRWGGRIRLYFHWEELKPIGCWVSLFEGYFRPEERVSLP